MKKLGLLFCLCLGLSSLFAQQLEPVKAVFQQVDQFHQSQKAFTPANFFGASQRLAPGQVDLKAEVEEATLLTLDASQVQEVASLRPALLEFTIPNANGKALELEVYRVNPMAADFVLTTSDPEKAPAQVDAGLHYRGVLKNDPFSLVSFSVIGNELMGLVSTEDGNFVLGKLKGTNAANTHILYLDTDLTKASPFACATQDDGVMYSPQELANPSSNKAGDCVRIYLEADNDFYAAANDDANVVVSYLTGVFNEVATLYANENISYVLSEVFVWTSRSPYRGRSESQLLSQFSSERTSFNGDLAALVNLDNLGGIAAGFSGLCNPNNSQRMCYAALQTSYNQVPTYSWTVMVLTHELGHLMGSRHTHACVWNGNGTAIDGCAGGTEGTCPVPGYPSGGGTIMSYCHIQNVGIDLTQGFGPQPGNVIRNSVVAANCLTDCGGTNTCNNGVQDGDETGVDCGGSCPACTTCNNGVQDGDETGVDCGGSCPPCTTCNNGVMDGDETGVDCGGSCPACVGPCATPDGLVATNIKRNRAKLNWNSVAGANDYTVQIRSGGGAWSSATTGGTNITASSLSNNTTYEWQVSANCTGGSSAWSTMCSFTAGDAGSGACGTNLVIEWIPSLYPNPAQEEINLSFISPRDADIQVSVLDMMGRTLSSFEMNSVETKTLDVREFAEGMYFIRTVAPNEEVRVLKFMVE